MIVPNQQGIFMNRFNFMSYTVAVALALTACASTTKPGAVGAQRQQLLLVSADTVEKMAL